MRIKRLYSLLVQFFFDLRIANLVHLICSTMGGMRTKAGFRVGGSDSDGEENLDWDISAEHSEVKVSVPEFLNLLKGVRERKRENDPDVIVHETAIAVDLQTEGETVGCFCEYAIHLEVIAAGEEDEKWASYRLFPSSTAITENQIGYGDDVRSAPKDVGSTKAHLKVDGGYVTFIAPGWKHYHYIVSVKTVRPFQTPQNLSAVIDSIEGVHTEITCQLPDQDWKVSCDPSALTQRIADENKTKFTVPPTRSVKLQLSREVPEVDEEHDEEIAKKVVETIMSCEQFVVHSLGERLVRTTLYCDFDISQGTSSTFGVDLDDRVRVLNVEGRGIKRWFVREPVAAFNASGVVDDVDDSHVSDDEEDERRVEATSTAPSEMDGGSNCRHLRVLLDHAAESSYSLVITTEIELESTSVQLKLPTFRCTKVRRNTGFVAVLAITNIEIKVVGTRSVATIDPSELTGKYRSRCARPIVHCYKFLNPQYDIELDIRKHTDAGVLIAIADDGYFEATVAREGTIFHHLTVNIRNEKKQFLRIQLPSKECNVWSAEVAGSTVKPAKDRDGFLLVPLERTSASSRSEGSTFQVQLVFVEYTHPLLKSGTLEVSFPQLDIPINHMHATVFVPTEFKMGEFTGDLKEVENAPVKNLNISAPMNRKAKRMIGGSRGRSGILTSAPSPPMPQMQMQMPTSNIMLEENEYQYDSAEDSETMFGMTPQCQASTSQACGGDGITDVGAKPVRVDRLATGTPYYFERLLVTNEKQQVSATYKEKHVKLQRHKGKLRCCEIM